MNKRSKTLILVFIILINCGIFILSAKGISNHALKIESEKINGINLSNQGISWKCNMGLWVYSVAISSDSNYIVAVGAESLGNYYVSLFNKDNSNPLWTYYTESYLFCVSISDNGDYIIVGGENHLFVFNKSNSTPIWIYYTSESMIKSVDISSDATYIIAASDHKAFFFDITSNTPLKIIDPGYEVSITSNGDYFVVSSNDESDKGNICLFNRTTFTPIWDFSFDSFAFSVAISPNGQYIAGGTGNGTLLLFETGSATPSWYTTVGNIDSLAFSADGQYLVIGKGYDLSLFDTSNSVPLWSYTTVGGNVLVDISSNGNYIIAGTLEEIYLFNRLSNVTLWTLPLLDFSISLDISSQGEYIVGGGNGGILYLLPTDAGTNIIPNIDFEANCTIIDKGEFIQFNFSGSPGDGLVTYLWDFGDGSEFSNDKDPIHRYAKSGNFDVKLNVTDSDGDMGLQIKLDYIVVNETNSVPGYNFFILIGGIAFISIFLTTKKKILIKN